jgi:folylpolyglutamate synthase/dihydropteroate synthase
MKDKMIEEVINLMAEPFQEIYLAQIPSIRAAEVDALKTFCPTGKVVSDPYQAYHAALSGAATTVVAGSFFLVGEILKALRVAR